jgi:DNA-binding transcriptional ArsR family regulator
MIANPVSPNTRPQIKLECFKHSSIGCVVKKTLLHGLFPAVRAEVLRLLFTNPGQELYTRELARLSFLALRTVQDELAKLEVANLILSRTNGYQRFYRANPKHPLHAAVTEIVRKGAAHPKAEPRPLKSRRKRDVNRRPN